MTAAVDERSASAGAVNGGVPARRAVIRWAWRLLRREWRQQLLILALITAAVAATFVGAAVATNTPVPAAATFGAANDLASFPGSTADLPARIATLAHDVGRVGVIENQTLAVPGSVVTYSLRAQRPQEPFGQPMLSLVTGHYPSGAGQVALTSGVAADLGLKIGGTWRADGTVRRVVGIVANPQNLLDEFALVAPGQVTEPTQVTVLFDAPRLRTVPAALTGATVQTRASAASANAINPTTISLAGATLGMLLIALVSIGGFTVLAQRRLRSIGMLGAQGATDRHIGLVVRANGLATGVVGAVAGAALGLLAWLAYRPRAEASAHHLMGAFQLPWLVIVIAMALAVVAAYLAAARPARAIARIPIVAALAGRPPAPRQARRGAVPAGLVLLVIAFFLIGLASEKASSGGGGQPFIALIGGLIALCAGVVLVAPACLTLLARAARRGPVVVRLALRDLARYQLRSGAALAAISISVLIAVIICVISAARFGNTLDYAGPNLAANQLIVHVPAGPAPAAVPARSPHGKPRTRGTPPPGGPLTAADLAAMAAHARGIAASLGSADVIQLETTSATLRHSVAGRNWTGTIYVATPQLLHGYGMSAARVGAADILTMRPGLSTTTRMQLDYGPGASNDAEPAGGAWPCPPSSCLPNPKIEEVSALPPGTSAPNTVITEHAVHQLGLPTTTVGWLIQTTSPLTAAQVSAAQRAAGAAGMTVETRNSIPTLAEIVDVATVFAALLALGILAMSVGLIRSETATQLRTLTAAGASGTARRAISATTAGALALTGALAGTAGGYIAAIGFFRTSQLDSLSALRSVPVANLLLTLVGMPLAGVIGGWLLAGREPTALGRRPLE
ncbi:MAG: FtsX-like permease family protein [Streptosporangiaceae bacterium]